MRVIIAGGSKFSHEMIGKLLIRSIKKLVVIIEEKEEAMEISNKYPDVMVVNNDPLSPEVLGDLDLENCDVFVSDTGKEASNLIVALYAQKHGAKKIFVRITNPNTKSIIEKLDMIPIDVNESASHDVVLSIAEPLVASLVGVGVGEYDIREKDVADFSNLIGKKVRDIEGSSFAVMAVFQDNKFEISASTVVKEGAKLILLEESGNEDKVNKLLKKLK
jgi:Trk K+ transport system NAD-binding subunit